MYSNCLTHKITKVFLWPLTLETPGLSCLGTRAATPQASPPALPHRLSKTTPQLHVHSTCSSTSPAPHLPSLLFHSSAPATWAGQPGLCYSRDGSRVCAGTLNGHLCFVIPEVCPVPVTTSFQSCPSLSHFGAQPLLPGTQQ